MAEPNDQFDDDVKRTAELGTDTSHEEKDMGDAEDMLDEAVKSLQNIQSGNKEEAHYFEAREHIEIAWWILHDNADQFNRK